MTLDLWDRVLEYVGQGGFVMPPLVLAAAVLWYGLGYRYLMLRRGNPRSARILLDRYLDDYPREPSGIVDHAVVEGVRILRTNEGRLRRHLDEAFAPFEEQLVRFRELTRTIVVVAPLLGLLGTVAGMVETFDSLADMSLFAQSGGVAGGISQALFSTQLGLAVAVPGMIVGRALNRRQDVMDMELAKLKAMLCAKEGEVT